MRLRGLHLAIYVLDSSVNYWCTEYKILTPIVSTYDACRFASKKEKSIKSSSILYIWLSLYTLSCELSHTLIRSPQPVGTGHHSQSHKNQNDKNLHHVELFETKESSLPDTTIVVDFGRSLMIATLFIDTCMLQ